MYEVLKYVLAAKRTDRPFVQLCALKETGVQRLPQTNVFHQQCATSNISVFDVYWAVKRIRWEHPWLREKVLRMNSLI